MGGWKRKKGEEVGESYSPTTLGPWVESDSIRLGRLYGMGQVKGQSLACRAGSPGRLRSLGNRLKKVAPFPLPRGLWDWRVASCMDNFSVPFAEDALTLLVLVSEKATHALTYSVTLAG